MDIVESKSFIPKSTFAQSGGSRVLYKDAGVGVIFKLGVVLFLLAVLAFGASFWYKGNLQKEIDSFADDLERAKAAFDPSFVSEVEDLMGRMAVAEKLVAIHPFPSHVLELLEKLTIADVRFTKFDYSLKPRMTEKGEEFDMALTLDGEAKSYKVLAQQTEVFQNTPDVVSESFSNFSLTDTGTVSFTLKLELNRLILSL